MTSEYRIDPSQLLSSAGRVQNSSGDIMERIGAVMREVQNSEAYWTGSAKQRYQQLMDRWNKAASDVQKTLDETVTALQQASTEYAQTEQTQARRFGG